MATRTTTSSASRVNTSRQLIVAIDPSSGASSPVGLAIIDPETMDIIEAVNLFTKYKKTEHRIRDLTLQLKAYFDQLEEYDCIVAMETFVMAGKSGQVLHQARGAFMSVIPYHFKQIEVHNTKLKSFIAKHGAADKKTMGRALERFFTSNKMSLQLIKDLTSKDESDIIDAIAIGVFAWQNERKNK